MVRVSVISLDYVTRHNMPVGWTATNKHDQLKYQAIHIGLDWEADKMAVYTNIKACCLDGEGWLWIKYFNSQEDGQHTTTNLREHYEGAGEVNKRVAWATANMDNAHSTSENTNLFEKFSTVLQDCFTILNNSGESYLDNQMARKMLEVIFSPIYYVYSRTDKNQTHLLPT